MSAAPPQAARRAVALPPALSWFALAATSLLVSLGTYWAFQKGANDFSVFYGAWRLVLSGHGVDIYHATPDRFLYAPGFAWWLAPLGLLPRGASLAVWCFLKAAIIGYIIREFGAHLAVRDRASAFGIGALAALVVARPILIDFEYGQVNTLILGACAWALLSHFRRDASALTASMSWTVLSMAAFAKIFPLPLLIIPWLPAAVPADRRRRYARIGTLLGLAAVVLAPVVSEGWQGGLHLLFLWRDAVVARGLPMESHNQSFAALLEHYFSGNPTQVFSEGMIPMHLGEGWLSQSAIGLLSMAWTCSMLGLVLGWIFLATSRPPLVWIAVLVGLLIVPSHLVWKPYLVMGLPLAILAVHRSIRALTESESAGRLIALLVIFAGINLTGFDFVGHGWGAHIEAASSFLFLHFGLLALVLADSSPRAEVGHA